MTAIKVQPDTEYGRAEKNIGFDVDHEIYDMWILGMSEMAAGLGRGEDKVMRALKYFQEAYKPKLDRAIEAHAKLGWEVDYSRNPVIAKSPLQMDMRDVPAFEEREVVADAHGINDYLYRTGMTHMFIRVFFKKAVLDLLPRPEIPVSEDRGFAVERN